MDYNKIVDNKLVNTKLKRIGQIEKRKQFFYLECPYGHKKKMTFDTIQVKKNFECEECKKIKQFKEFTEVLNNEGYNILGSFEDLINVQSKIKTECPKGHIWYGTYNRVISEGKRCSKCSRNQRLTPNFIKQQIEKQGYKIYNYKEYKNAQTKLKIKCPKGHITNTMTYANWRKGYRCYECLSTKKKKIEDIKKILEEEGYKLLQDKYINSFTPLKIKCPKGHITNTMTYANWRQGKRCSICRESTGERLIRDFLEKNDIEYERQKSFEGCVLRKPLLFDFFIPNKNVCIEYDGEQHFHPVDCFGGKKEFKKVKKRDSIKEKYCHENNIRLIRIPYWEKENIEEIIKNI